MQKAHRELGEAPTHSRATPLSWDCHATRQPVESLNLFNSMSAHLGGLKQMGSYCNNFICFKLRTAVGSTELLTSTDPYIYILFFFNELQNQGVRLKISVRLKLILSRKAVEAISSPSKQPCKQTENQNKMQKIMKIEMVGEENKSREVIYKRRRNGGV